MVCTQLGYLMMGSNAYTGTCYGQGTCPIWMLTWTAQATSHISTVADSVDGARIIALKAETPAWIVDTACQTFSWQMAVITMALLKFTTMGNGADCAMIAGTSMMPKWCVATLDSPANILSTAVRFNLWLRLRENLVA